MQEPNTTPREGINSPAGFCFSYSIPTESVFLLTIISIDNKASIYASCHDNTYKFINIFQTYYNMKGSHLRLN